MHNDKMDLHSLSNAWHSFRLNGLKSRPVYKLMLEKFETDSEKTPISQQIITLNNIIENKLVNHKKYPGHDIELNAPKQILTDQEIEIIDKILSNYSKNYEKGNFLDCKAVHKALVNFCEYLENEGMDRKEILDTYTHVFNSNFALYENFALTAELNDLTELFYGMHFVVEIESNESIQFVKHIKYMLKRTIEHHKVES